MLSLRAYLQRIRTYRQQFGDPTVMMAVCTLLYTVNLLTDHLPFVSPSASFSDFCCSPPV
jgi:hypothetical protein